MLARLPLDPYASTLTLVDSRRTFKRLTGHDATDSVGMVGTVDGGWVLGWFDGEPLTLVHEATHVALFVLEHVGIDPFASQGEPMAYLVEDIVRRCSARRRLTCSAIASSRSRSSPNSSPP